MVYFQYYVKGANNATWTTTYKSEKMSRTGSRPAMDVKLVLYNDQDVLGGISVC